MEILLPLTAVAILLVAVLYDLLQTSTQIDITTLYKIPMLVGESGMSYSRVWFGAMEYMDGTIAIYSRSSQEFVELVQRSRETILLQDATEKIVLGAKIVVLPNSEIKKLDLSNLKIEAII